MNRSRLPLALLLLLLLLAGACARRGWSPEDEPDRPGTPPAEQPIEDRDLGEGADGEDLGAATPSASPAGDAACDVAPDPAPTDGPVPVP